MWSSVKGFQTFTFWFAIAIASYLYEVKYDAIQSKKIDLYKSAQDARFILSSGQTECADGWISSSIGDGSCSHHGGVKRSNNTLGNLANLDEEKITDSRVTKLRVTIFLILMLVYFISPAIDSVIWFLFSLNSKKVRAPKNIVPIAGKTGALVVYPMPKSSPIVSSPPLINQNLCPKCGGAMVLRTAKKGKFRGKNFHGCQKYPYCHGIRNIDI